MADGKVYVAYVIVYKAWDDPGIPEVHTHAFSTFDKAKAFIESKVMEVCKVKTIDPRYDDGEWERWEECDYFDDIECDTAHFKLCQEKESSFSSYYWTLPIADKDGEAVDRYITHWYLEVCEVDV